MYLVYRTHLWNRRSYSWSPGTHFHGKFCKRSVDYKHNPDEQEERCFVMFEFLMTRMAFHWILSCGRGGDYLMNQIGKISKSVPFM